MPAEPCELLGAAMFLALCSGLHPFVHAQYRSVNGLVLQEYNDTVTDVKAYGTRKVVLYI